MSQNVIYIKNMVCDRCIKSVSKILCDMQIEHQTVLLGEVSSNSQIDTALKEELKYRLRDEGFELIDDKNSRIIEKIKNVVISVIQEYEGEDIEKINFPNRLSRKLEKSSKDGRVRVSLYHIL